MRRRPTHGQGVLLGLGLASTALSVLSVLAVVGLAGPARAPVAAGPSPVAATVPAAPVASASGPTASGPTAPAVTPPRPTVSPAQRARCAAPAVACVDTVARVAWLQQGGSVVYGPVPILPGANTGIVPAGPHSAATPFGTFHVLRKDADHTSNEFDEPMPHAIFFAAGGIAFHEGSLVEPSHGCVHLTASDAAAFYDRLAIGDDVEVF